MKITHAYVYKWTELSSGRWYIGSRTKIGCHPDDSYICSSKVVLPLIKTNPTNWKRTILCIGHPMDMLALETNLLLLVDAKNDPLSYNMHNGDGKFSTAGVEPWNKGLKQPTGKPAWNRGLTKENNPSMAIVSSKRKLQPAHNKGKAMSDELKLQKSIAMKGRPSPKKGIPGPKQTAEAKAKMSIALKGKKQSNEHITNRANARRGKKNSKVSVAKGVPKIKTVTRIFDRKEMSAGHYTTWNNSQNKRTN